jgi:hypothetical protein
MNIIRLLVLFYLSILVGCASSDETVKTRIDQVLAPLESLMASDPSGLAAQKHLNKEWLPSYVFQPYLYEVPQTLFESSPERDERVRKIEQWMAPYEQSLIKVLLACQSNWEPPNAVVGYLQFAAPTPQLRDALLSVARNPEALPHYAAKAYDKIFMLDMGDPELVNEVIDLIKERDEKTKRADLGRDLMGRTSKWALPEMKEIYLKFLRIPYKPENYSFPGGKLRLRTDYQRAIEGLMAFGKLDDSVVSMMKERLAEIPQEEDPDLHRLFRDSLLIAEGNLRPEPVVNLKGQLLGISKEKYPAWLAAHPATQSAVKERPDRRTSELADGGMETKKSSDPSAFGSLVQRVGESWGLWLTGICGILIATILVWRWKSTP